MCSIEGCDKLVLARGWCSRHYNRWLRYGDPLAGRAFRDTPLIFRFFNKVLIGDGCWEWTEYCDANGYGRYIRKEAHRVAWQIWYGPIPNGLHVLHKCDNPPCVRPDHLFLGTHQDNMADRKAKGGYATAESPH